MEVEIIQCECCCLIEDCTQSYITDIKSKFNGKWLCGLCAEAVRDEGSKDGRMMYGVEEAIMAHMSFCRQFNSNPAIQVADGMKKILRRLSNGLTSSSRGSSSAKRSFRACLNKEY